MARLNIAERSLPQDGRLNITVNGKGIDFRVAKSLTIHGESLALRMLDRQEGELDFARLGFDAGLTATTRTALQKPYGIVLSTGPTGSGKTTTLYTALKELNQPEQKILTINEGCSKDSRWCRTVEPSPLLTNTIRRDTSRKESIPMGWSRPSHQTLGESRHK